MSPAPNDDPNLALDAFMRRAAPLFAKASLSRVQAAPRINLPPVKFPARPNAAHNAAVAQTTAQVSALAAAHWQADARAALAPVPQPEFGDQADPSPRLLSKWQPGAWTGARRQLAPPTTEVLQTRQGPFINNHAEQHLVMLWAPVQQRSPRLRLERWPTHTFVCGANAQALDEAVLAQVPESEALWWLPEGVAMVDWALACKIILRQHDLLRPFQVNALQALLDAQAQADAPQASGGYDPAAFNPQVSQPANQPTPSRR